MHKLLTLLKEEMLYIKDDIISGITIIFNEFKKIKPTKLKK